jgi:hypothetical protein
MRLAVLLTLGALSAAAQPKEFLPAPEDPGRQARATIGLIGLFGGYGVALTQDVWLIAEMAISCGQRTMTTAECVTAPATALGLGALSLVPVVGPAVMGWVLDTGVGPVLRENPTFGHRIVGFVSAAAQLAGLLLIFSALDGAPAGGGALATLSGRW